MSKACWQAVSLCAGLTLVALALSNCGAVSPGPRVGYVEIRVNWPGSDALAASAGIRGIPPETEKLRVTITGQGFDPIVSDITRSDIDAGRATRRIAVPVGAGRTVEVRALDAGGRTVASGRTIVDVEAGATLRVRVVLVRTEGTEPAPIVVSRTIQLTRFDGNFVPLKAATPQPSAQGVAGVRLSPLLPPNAVSGTLSLDFFEPDGEGNRAVVATLVIHNAVGLWIARGFYQGPMADHISFETGVTNDYITAPGGYTTNFKGSLLDLDVVIGAILDPLQGPGTIEVGFDGPDPLVSEEITGSVDIGTGPDRTLIGSLTGELVF